METDWSNWLADGLIENGCQHLSIALMEGAYQFQESATHAAKISKFPFHAENTINEKIGYEVALTYSYGKKRAAFLTHGFSLPVAMDPLMNSIYTGVAGGFVVITLDATPPLNYSSRCDPVSLAMFAKMPVLELSELGRLSPVLKQAFTLSERFETPVMLHIDTKIPSGTYRPRGKTGKRRRTEFEKNPARWAATPRFRFLLHKKLNQRLREISEYGIKDQILKINGKGDNLGIICNNANLSFVMPWAERHQVSVLSIQMLFPLPVESVSRFIKANKNTVIIEDRYPTIQFQLPEGSKIPGRMTDQRFRHEFSWRNDVLTPRLDEIRTGKIRNEDIHAPQPSSSDAITPQSLRKLLGELKASDSSLIIVADKTPITIGLPADRFVSRGGSIGIAAGYAHARDTRTSPQILCITDSSAFLHYGMQATVNAIYNTAPVKCLMLVRPEHEAKLYNFLNAMEHVDTIPLSTKSDSARKKLKRDTSQPVTIFTVPMEKAA